MHLKGGRQPLADSPRTTIYTIMKLIVLSTPDFYVEEDKIITDLFEEGLDTLHLRKPESEPVLSERLLSLIPEQYHSRIMVHHHFYLKEEYNLMGIHLNRRSPIVPQDYRGKKSRSCYSLEELSEARGSFDYCCLDNVFDSISNPIKKSTLSHDEIKDAARRGLIDRKVMAMGGITLENIEQVQEMGFGGAIVCGDLWSKFDIHGARDYKNLLKHFRLLRNATL